MDCISIAQLGLQSEELCAHVTGAFNKLRHLGLFTKYMLYVVQWSVCLGSDF